jgi:hypothetical protein
VNYFTQCLVAAHHAVHAAMRGLQRNDGFVQKPAAGQIDVPAPMLFCMKIRR